MFIPSNPDKSPININAVRSVLLYSAFIVTTLCLSVIAMGVDLQEALSNAPSFQPTAALERSQP
jgi:hypothetical protein